MDKWHNKNSRTSYICKQEKRYASKSGHSHPQDNSNTLRLYAVACRCEDDIRGMIASAKKRGIPFPSAETQARMYDYACKRAAGEYFYRNAQINRILGGF